MVFSRWNPENKYILKANQTDPSRCKNLICADIWADMVKARENVPEELHNLSNYGAVDGFPIAVYFDDKFHGLYTMNLHKDDDLFGMKDGKDQAIMIINHADGAEAQFREAAVFEDETPWEVEYCGTEDTLWAREKLNALIDFVQTSTDTEFRTKIGNYLDLESAIDYVIAMYAFDLQEHSAKDLILVTYGKDSPWICSMYDMEEAFDDGCMPVFNGTSWESGTGSLLWDRFINAFYPEICARYEALRNSLLDSDVLTSRVESYVAQIPDIIYKADASARGSDLYTNAQTVLMTDTIRQALSELNSVFLTERK